MGQAFFSLTAPSEIALISTAKVEGQGRCADRCFPGMGGRAPSSGTMKSEAPLMTRAVTKSGAPS